jgi:hypothetical protein
VQSISGARILVFSKTAGWRHDSIPAGIAAFEKLANEQQFSVVATEDSAVFTDAELSQFNAIVFLNTTLNVLDENQELAMERYIQAGGGFVGIHAAADTEWEGEWFWYRNLVGAVFKDHPNTPSNVQQATVNSIKSMHQQRLCRTLSAWPMSGTTIAICMNLSTWLPRLMSQLTKVAGTAMIIPFPGITITMVAARFIRVWGTPVNHFLILTCCSTCLAV